MAPPFNGQFKESISIWVTHVRTLRFCVRRKMCRFPEFIKYAQNLTFLDEIHEFLAILWRFNTYRTANRHAILPLPFMAVCCKSLMSQKAVRFNLIAEFCQNLQNSGKSVQNCEIFCRKTLKFVGKTSQNFAKICRILAEFWKISLTCQRWADPTILS